MPNTTMKDKIAARATRWNSRSARAGTMLRSRPTIAPTKALTSTRSENWRQFWASPSRGKSCPSSVNGAGAPGPALPASVPGHVVVDDRLDAAAVLVREGAEAEAEAGGQAVHRVLLAGIRPGHDSLHLHLELAVGD